MRDTKTDSGKVVQDFWFTDWHWACCMNIGGHLGISFNWRAKKKPFSKFRVFFFKIIGFKITQIFTAPTGEAKSQ